jgi:hypothetical protein
MKLAPGLHSQSTALAISSAVPKRPIGIEATEASMSRSPVSTMCDTIGVSVVPGQIALIRTPRGARSLVRPPIPCFDAWYAARPGTDPDQTAGRWAVNDGSVALLAHLAQLVLHTCPHAAEVDGVAPVASPAPGHEEPASAGSGVHRYSPATHLGGGPDTTSRGPRRAGARASIGRMTITSPAMSFQVRYHSKISDRSPATPT